MTDISPSSSILGFSSCMLDRCDHVRVDPVLLAEWFADPAALHIILDGLNPVLNGDSLVREPLPAHASPDTHALLGCLEDRRPLFVELKRGTPHNEQFGTAMWDAANILSAEELSLYGAARSLVDWHARHCFCAVCGAPTKPVKAGWSRQCQDCRAHHFPRVDPVVIMLAEYDGKVLVGRQPRFLPRRFSALAGFVEPGETLEGAVARELFEEAGIRVSDVRYVMSQPWPFPSSMMIACTAQAHDDALTLDTQELEHAFWASADDVRAALAGAPDAPFLPPPPMAVAHHLLKYWLQAQD